VFGEAVVKRLAILRHSDLLHVEVYGHAHDLCGRYGHAIYRGPLTCLVAFYLKNLFRPSHLLLKKSNKKKVTSRITTKQNKRENIAHPTVHRMPMHEKQDGTV